MWQKDTIVRIIEYARPPALRLVDLYGRGLMWAGRVFKRIHLSGHRLWRNTGSNLLAWPPGVCCLFLTAWKPPPPARPPADPTRRQHGPHCGAHCLGFGPVLRCVRWTLLHTEQALLHPPAAREQLRSEVSETNISGACTPVIRGFCETFVSVCVFEHLNCLNCGRRVWSIDILFSHLKKSPKVFSVSGLFPPVFCLTS